MEVHQQKAIEQFCSTVTLQVQLSLLQKPQPSSCQSNPKKLLSTAVGLPVSEGYSSGFSLIER